MRRILIAGVVVAAAITAGCGGGGDHTNPASPGASHQGSAGEQDPTAGHTKSYQTGYWWAYNHSNGHP
jgi:hypothetical protein